MEGASQGQVTFTKDVAPILQRSCQVCHRPGSIAPMSLLTYEDVRPWARAIKDRVSLREMPPWYIERNVGVRKFKGDRSLSEEEIAAIVKWVDSGAPQGNLADTPPPRQFADVDQWSIGKPDLIVSIPEELTIQSVAADWWVDINTNSGLTEDRYIKAVETKPAKGAQRVVHHVATSMIFPSGDDDGREGGGFLNEYAVGKNGDIFAENSGRLIKARTKIHFNLHYHSIGEEIKDRSSVAFVFYPRGVVPKHVVVTQHVGDSFDTIDLPAGADNVRSDGYVVLSKAARVTSFQPHMHNRGKRMCVEAIYQDGRIETLSCAKHNFEWMIVYNYEDDVAPLLPAGTILHVIGWHDNSAKNKYNPDPRNWAGFGNRSIDDMSFAWMSFEFLGRRRLQAASRSAKVKKIEQLAVLARSKCVRTCRLFCKHGQRSCASNRQEPKAAVAHLRC